MDWSRILIALAILATPFVILGVGFLAWRPLYHRVLDLEEQQVSRCVGEEEEAGDGDGPW